MNKILCILLAFAALSFAPATANARLPVSQPHNTVVMSLPAVGSWVWASNAWWVLSDRWYYGSSYTWNGWRYTDVNMLYRRVSDGYLILLAVTYGRR